MSGGAERKCREVIVWSGRREGAYIPHTSRTHISPANETDTVMVDKRSGLGSKLRPRISSLSWYSNTHRTAVIKILHSYYLPH